MPNILFLSDNQVFQDDLSQQIVLELSEDYKVLTQDNEETVFDIAVLDGLKFFPGFREKHQKVPALIFIASEEELPPESKLESFLYKPLILASFINQIQSSINVFKNTEAGILRFSIYELHPQDKEILNRRTKEIVKLTEKEVNIIQYLYKAKTAVSKNELLENVWEYSADATTHTIETHIYRLRKKVETNEKSPQLIFAEENGYKLAD